MDATNIEPELNRLIQAGDRRRAAAVIVERLASDVYALCRAMVRDATLAEDLSQDAFGRAIASLDTFRGESSARTWVLAIARNRCLDHLRATRRAPVDGGGHDVDAHASEAPPALDVLVGHEDARRALNVLGENERAIVVLHFGHGVGYAELADAFGMKEGALRMRISRAVARMREAIAPEPPERRGRRKRGPPVAAKRSAPTAAPGAPLSTVRALASALRDDAPPTLLDRLRALAASA